MNGKYPIALGSGELGCRFQRELQGGNAAEQWEGSSGALDCTKQQQQNKTKKINFEQTCWFSAFSVDESRLLKVSSTDCVILSC